MRAISLNPWAVAAAAVAIFAIGFVIYGVIFAGEAWMQMSALTKADLDAVGSSRMRYMAIMPIVTAICMAILVAWCGARTWRDGALLGFVVALGSAAMARFYGRVYGVQGIDIATLDIVHLVLGHVAAGAILAGWPQKGPSAT
jgi:hypothetical protein